MTETEERLVDLCETLAEVSGNTARMCVDVVEILQSALGLREGLRQPDDLYAPSVDLTGRQIKGMR